MFYHVVVVVLCVVVVFCCVCWCLVGVHKRPVRLGIGNPMTFKQVSEVVTN